MDSPVPSPMSPIAPQQQQQQQQHQGKRTLLVVDGSYLVISAKRMNLQINYMKLVKELEKRLGCEFYEKWFINGGEGNNVNSAFNNMLRAAPPTGPQFRVKILGLKTHTSYCKNCRRDVETKVQKGVDVSIATLILKHSFQNLCDQIVLIAGDGDFYDALSTCKDELRKELVLVGFQDHTLSLDLQQLAKVVWINGMADDIRDGPQYQQQYPQQPQQPEPFHFQPPSTQSIHAIQQQQQQQALLQQQQQQQLQLQAQLQAQQMQAQLQAQQQQQQQQQQLLHRQQMQAQLQQHQQQQLTQLPRSSLPHPHLNLQSQPQQSQQPQQPQQTQLQKPTQHPQPQHQQMVIQQHQQLLQMQQQQQASPQKSPQPQAAAQPPVSPIKPPVPETWACASCTFINQAASQTCEICASPKPRAPASPVLSLASTPTPAQGSVFMSTSGVLPTLPPAPASVPYKPTGLPILGSQLGQPAKPVEEEKIYPCPICTFHRKSEAVCEMCGFHK